LIGVERKWRFGAVRTVFDPQRKFSIASGKRKKPAAMLRGLRFVNPNNPPSGTYTEALWRKPAYQISILGNSGAFAHLFLRQLIEGALNKFVGALALTTFPALFAFAETLKPA
jgi:hypothetical protein